MNSPDIEKLIDIIKKASVDKAVKELATICIEKAYSIGFADGMKQASEIQTAVHNAIFGNLQQGGKV